MKYLIPILLLIACGKIPDATIEVPSPTPTPTVTPLAPTPSPAPVVATTPTPTPSPTSTVAPIVPITILKFIFQNSIGICDALKNWNTNTQTIIFPNNSGTSISSTFLYVFEKNGVFIENLDGTGKGKLDNGDPITIVEEGALNHPPVCTITVNHAQLENVK